MFSVCLVFSLIALTQAAGVVPVPSASQVDVRRSGADFSYNIQESVGVGHHPALVQLDETYAKGEAVNEKHVEHNNKDQVRQDLLKVEARSHLEMKDLKRPSEEIALINQPLLAPPLEYYGYLYPYSGYSITTLPKASLVPSFATLPVIPYPYTLIRAV